MMIVSTYWILGNINDDREGLCFIRGLMDRFIPLSAFFNVYVYIDIKVISR
jgi:hypothetical protein